MMPRPSDYLTILELALFADGGIDRTTMVHVLREAHGNLSSDDYKTLLRDVRELVGETR